jgi:multidrug efflux pump
MEVTIFTQIGFVVLVGLASKNAILIVEFAKQRQEAGVPRRQATLEAVKLRLRPILMTSFAFILGVVPLVVATGAGAEMRRSLGVAVFAGMLGVTLFGIFLTPVFYYVIQWFGDRRPGRAKAVPLLVEAGPASPWPGNGGGGAGEQVTAGPATGREDGSLRGAP